MEKLISMLSELSAEFAAQPDTWKQMTILEAVTTIEALQQENKQLQAQVVQMREALEEATETIENIYEKDTPQTEKYRDILNVGTTEYHNPADMEALKQAREALKGVNVVRCPYCWGKETHSDKCEISKAIENIDKAIGGKEDA